MDIRQHGDITDPSDFSQEGFRKLDSTFRCTICKDFFEAPVLLTQCGHTFCSHCIRTHLPTKPECPLCRKSTKETHLVRNVALAEAVETWSKMTRQAVLDLAKNSIRSSGINRASKKRKLQDCIEEPRSNTKDPSFQYPSGVELSDEEIITIPSSLQVEAEEIVGSKSKRQFEKSEEEEEVPCPICSKQVLISSINPHMDSKCKRFLAEEEKVDRTRSRAAWTSIFKKEGKRRMANGSHWEASDTPTMRLAKVSYGTLTLAGLKKLVSDCGLPTTGDKDALVTRHERWLAVYNANLDLAQPKPLSELKVKLNELEEAASRPGPKKICDEKDWTKKNRSQFKHLIAQAKGGDGSTSSRLARTRTQLNVDQR